MRDRPPCLVLFQHVDPASPPCVPLSYVSSYRAAWACDNAALLCRCAAWKLPEGTHAITRRDLGRVLRPGREKGLDEGLRVVQREGAPSVELKHNGMVLSVRDGADQAAKEAVMARWYRDQIKALAPQLISKWEPVLGVSVKRVFVQQMKTKWGSCNPRAGTIRLNTELAKKPKECLEYIVAHELVHLIEPTHNARFVALMDRFMPRWQFYRQRLNRLPVRHADWGY